VRIGPVAVGIHVLIGLVKITAYDEPEGVTFLAFDAVLALLLLAARRNTGERA
jgi:hypothetical protein